MTDWADLRQALRERGLTIHRKCSALDRRSGNPGLQLWSVRDNGFMVADFDRDRGTVAVHTLDPARTFTDPAPDVLLDLLEAHRG